MCKSTSLTEEEMRKPRLILYPVSDNRAASIKLHFFMACKGGQFDVVLRLLVPNRMLVMSME